MKKNIEEDIIKKVENPQYVDLITLIRQFKKEGLESFIVSRKNNFDTILSDYKRVLKENEELKYKYDKALSDVIAGVDLDNTYIPVQKIQDKIEEIEKAYEESKNEYGETPYYYPNYTIDILQDLLEEKGE